MNIAKLNSSDDRVYKISKSQGGGQGAASSMHFYNVPSTAGEVIGMIATFSSSCKHLDSNGKICISPAGLYVSLLLSEGTTCSMVAIDFEQKVYQEGKMMTMKEALDAFGLLESFMSSGITEVTEAEFYDTSI